MTSLVWFDKDLRLADNPALFHAVETSDVVVPVFVWSPHEAGDWAPGGAQQWWIHHALTALANDLRACGSRLLVRRGDSQHELDAVIDATGADAVYWNTRYEPALRRRDEAIAETLRARGLTVRTYAGRLLHDPNAVRTTSGGPYHVFTPFWKKLQNELDVSPALPHPALDASKAPADWPDALPLDTLALLPEARDGVDWATGLRETWTPGEQGAHAQLQAFIDEALIDYDEQRNRPDRDGTSALSPYLHHGELSPRQVWTAVRGWIHNAPMKAAAESYLRELAWREFSYHLLVHYPKTPAEPLKDRFHDFPWTDNPEALRRWQQGRTGFPIVDAGMRQLWHTGWMHNRVRMLVASFLTKDLLIPWQTGAHWFWDTLVDADLANNTMGWQWSAGCGADAQPFFRIFNPVTQGERYDPDGTYVRRWVPELAALPDRYLHAPWTAPDDVLDRAGLRLDEDYPRPLVDHAAARARALTAYQTLRSS